MPDTDTILQVRVGALALRSPLLAASGTCGFGEELERIGVTAALGALVTKTVTREPREGNPPPRICETSAGLINSIGLANPGWDYFRRAILPRLDRLGCPCVVNIGGKTEDEYVELARRLRDSPIPAALELNLSCPNVSEGGLEFSRDREALLRVTAAVRARWDRPLWVKLTPNVADIAPFAAQAARGGADAVVVANTWLGMAVDWRRRRSRIARPMGGFSGPAIKPLALRTAWQAAAARALPVIGCGGIAAAEDVLEFLVAGAAAVQLGSILMRDPFAPRHMDAALRALLAADGIARIAALTGTLQT
ncbi:MAG TPA: dihydroorotate dehydrogenase [Planctomycetota bacterium]|jgi:dihydroorotate dehydrogenase (NAD+) catalytic subunit|nr:dihydroorotate dehydrogenase [Planctomycetota bacterium]OQC20060.1 MAG: Dihydroorotate dehydrogenase B (NAD(+)), catalytic subunit [Planctomycetes bacterium ADurb.Bin069]HNR98687.1 dihydroorotate dehydrogenase [Planctomycetota bacterium]HNU25067.1 dihydroorotate dehydrogenase [Planctomycetota bacterium]HOE28449.1 dihydroorotate dehydrogenase [Planctomycetota bacterium]